MYIDRMSKNPILLYDLFIKEKMIQTFQRVLKMHFQFFTQKTLKSLAVIFCKKLFLIFLKN